MQRFDQFGEAAQHAKDLAATGVDARLRRDGESWIVDASQAEEPIQSPSQVIVQPHAFHVTTRQWRDLEQHKRQAQHFPRSQPAFSLHYAAKDLDPTDAETVLKYGEIFDALLRGYVQPANDIQSRFVELFRKGGKAQSGAEFAWLRYLREVQYCEGCYFSGRDEAEYRSRMRILATKGHKRAKEAVQSFKRWDSNPPEDKHVESLYPAIDYAKLGGRQMPGSFESGA